MRLFFVLPPACVVVVVVVVVVGGLSLRFRAELASSLCREFVAFVAVLFWFLFLFLFVVFNPCWRVNGGATGDGSGSGFPHRNNG